MSELVVPDSSTGTWFLAFGLAFFILRTPLARLNAALARAYARWLLRLPDRQSNPIWAEAILRRTNRWYRGCVTLGGILFSTIGLYLLLGGRGWW
jgi:hypothetical protein